MYLWVKSPSTAFLSCLIWNSVLFYCTHIHWTIESELQGKRKSKRKVIPLLSPEVHVFSVCVEVIRPALDCNPPLSRTSIRHVNSLTCLFLAPPNRGVSVSEFLGSLASLHSIPLSYLNIIQKILSVILTDTTFVFNSVLVNAVYINLD